MLPSEVTSCLKSDYTAPSGIVSLNPSGASTPLNFVAMANKHVSPCYQAVFYGPGEVFAPKHLLFTTRKINISLNSALRCKGKSPFNFSHYIVQDPQTQAIQNGSLSGSWFEVKTFIP